jgi:hypothetical protein
MSTVQTQGEISLVFIDHKFAHALRKVPRSGEFKVHGGTHELYQPSAHEIHTATHALNSAITCVYNSSDSKEPSLHQRCLFARVDMLCSEPTATTATDTKDATTAATKKSFSEGRTLYVSELELLEPDLFLRLPQHHNNHAPIDSLINAVIDRVTDLRTVTATASA